VELSHPGDALSTLLGARVVDGAGRRLGRVRDVRAARTTDGRITVDALLVGRRKRVVSWTDVREVRGRTIVVDGARR